MRYYETLYILNPNFEQEKNDEISKEVEEKIKKFCKVINHRFWGKKRLAYPIMQHKYGTYMLLQFETDALKKLEDFENFMKLNKSVLRFQTVRLNEKPDEFIEETADNTDVDVIETSEVEKTVDEEVPTTQDEPSNEEPSAEKETENDDSTETTEEEPVVEENS